MSFFVKKAQTTQLTTQQKREPQQLLGFHTHFVESEGIEPSSKQAMEELSTRLVFT